MYRPCVFSILTPLCHITFFVLRHSNSYCVNFVRISKNTVPYVPPEIFAAIFGSNLALISKNGNQLSGHKKSGTPFIYWRFPLFEGRVPGRTRTVDIQNHNLTL